MQEVRLIAGPPIAGSDMLENNPGSGTGFSQPYAVLNSLLCYSDGCYQCNHMQ